MPADEMIEQEDRWVYEALYNSLILLSLDVEDLDALAAPTFNPEFELISCWHYAFNDLYRQVLATPQISRSGMVEPLNLFKARLENAPESLWEYDAFKSDPFWQTIRQDANALLNRLGETENRQFERDQTSKPVRIPAGGGVTHNSIDKETPQ